MGILTYYLIATDAEVAALTIDDNPWQLFESMPAKRVDIVELAYLQVILCGSTFEEALDAQPQIREFDKDGPWIRRFPEPIIPILADASAEKLRDTADAWRIATASLSYTWTLEDTHKFLIRLSDFVRSALAANKPIFVWTSL